MSELATLNRDKRMRWARPGGVHDRNVRIARVALPSAVGALAAILAIAPLTKRAEVSFVLDKEKVAMATERMRVASAQYRGQDDEGRAFVLNAGSAVQQSSRVPVVRLGDLMARLSTDTGPAVLAAPRANYNLEAEKLDVDGPLTFQTNDGYRLSTSDVGADLNTRILSSAKPVTGEMPLGRFSAGNMSVDLSKRTVVLGGRARLRIDQGAARARR